MTQFKNTNPNATFVINRLCSFLGFGSVPLIIGACIGILIGSAALIYCVKRGK